MQSTRGTGAFEQGFDVMDLEGTLSCTFSGLGLTDADRQHSLAIEYEHLPQAGSEMWPWTTMAMDDELGELGPLPTIKSPRPEPTPSLNPAQRPATAPIRPTVAPVQRPAPVGTPMTYAAVLKTPPPAPSAPPLPATIATPVVSEANPVVAGQRFGLDKLGQSAGSRLPCPVLTWVAGIVHCIGMDSEISGSDDSLTGLTMGPTLLDGGSGSETGLKLHFSQLKGPKGDLICHIARKVMEIMGKKEGMFKDWEALRKHLTEDKGLACPGVRKIKHFSFLWTGTIRGGNQDKDFTQTYYERRFTPSMDQLTAEQRKADRLAGGGGNPGLFAHCGFLLKRDHPGVYERAKAEALADVANGLQVNAFEERFKEQLLKERLARSQAKASPPATKSQRKSFTKKIADTRNAEKHVLMAKAAMKQPIFQQWVAANPEAIARSYLASKQFTTDQINYIEACFRNDSNQFSVKAIRGLIGPGGLVEFRRTVLASSPLPRTDVDEGLSLEDSADATSSASSTSSLTRQRSANSEAADDGHRIKRSTLAKMTSKGPGTAVTTASPPATPVCTATATATPTQLSRETLP